MTEKRKRFECNIFLQTSESNPDHYGFFKVEFGQGMGYGFELIGSTDLRELGMAVMDINRKFKTIVKPGDFKSAASILGIDEYISMNCSDEELQEWLINQSDEFWDSCDSAYFAIGLFIEEKGLGFQNPKESVYGPDYERLSFCFLEGNDQLIIPKGTILKIPAINNCMDALDLIIGDGETYKKLKVKYWMRERINHPNCPEPYRDSVISLGNIQDITAEFSKLFGEGKYHWQLEHDLKVTVRHFEYKAGNQGGRYDSGLTCSFQEYGDTTLRKPASIFVYPKDLEGIEFLRMKHAE